ncbi:hypothetical protein KEM55_002294 [Ascosphaera atra]|nr:hypothetical protein KEM55_002294 [Ascosphaera atra]
MPHWKHYSQTAMPHGDDAGAPGHDVLPSAPRKVHSHDDLLHSSARPTSQLQSGSIQGIGQYVASRKAAVPRPNCPAYVMCDVSRPSTSNAYDSEGFTGLYVDQPVRLHLIEDDRRPHPSALMDTMRPQEPKETHTAAVEVNEQTGNKLINEYEIIGELGRGEHGKVKLGIHGITGRKVAIKIVRRHSKSRRLGKAANSEDNVKKEVAILKKARHPNIVSLLEVIDDPSQLKAYIVLEYVENGEIIWRRRGLEEISIVDRKRIEREKKGLPESHSFIVESLQFVEAARHLRAQSRRTGDLTNLDNSTTNSGVQAWSLEHGGDAEEVDTEGGEAGTSEGANFVDDIVSAIKNSEYWTCYQTLRRIRFTGSSSAGAFDDVCGSDNDDFFPRP